MHACVECDRLHQSLTAAQRCAAEDKAEDAASRRAHSHRHTRLRDVHPVDD